MAAEDLLHLGNGVCRFYYVFVILFGSQSVPLVPDRSRVVGTNLGALDVHI